MAFLVDSNFLQSLGWAVLNSLWQMALLWVIFQVIVSSWIHKPSQKTKLATILVFTGFSWFLVTFIRHWLIDPDAAKNSFIALDSFRQGQSEKWNSALINALPWASIAYIFFLLIPIIQFLRNYKYVHTIRRMGLSKADVNFRIFVQKFADYVGIRKRVNVFVSELVSSPVTIGFLKPIILLPIAAISHLSTKQVEAILLHELAHIRRFDYFFNLLINFIKMVLYFNPFVKLFVRTIEREREKSCDDLVMQFQYDPYGYASALLVLEKNNSAIQMIAIAAGGRKNDLLHRVEKILGLEKTNVYDLRKLGGLLAGLICIIGLNILFILGKPVVSNQSVAIDNISNPLFLIYDGEQPKSSMTKEEKSNNLPERQPEHIVKLSPTKQPPKQPTVHNYPVHEMATPLTLTRVAATETIIPELNREAEAQVKGTVAATKKILKDGEWKEVEKNVADVLTLSEKESLRMKYNIDLEKMDWKKLENRLRVSYNNINWDNVNNKLNTAITKITLDSLTTVINVALADLDAAENWMTNNQCNSIPDTDLNLKAIQAQKEKVQQQLRIVNAVKQKKVVRI